MTKSEMKAKTIPRALRDVVHMLGLRVTYIRAYAGLGDHLAAVDAAVHAGDVRAAESAIVALEAAMDACDLRCATAKAEGPAEAFGVQHWYAIRTATRRERTAHDAVVEKGFTAFLPMETRWRQTPLVREIVQYPLLPGYVFVLSSEDALAAVLGLDGVHGIVMCTTADAEPMPMPFPLKVIIGLQIEERAGVYDRTRKQKAPYRPKKGEAVKITAGTWMGLVAKVLNTPRGQRVHVMIEAFGQRKGMTVDLKHVMAA